MGIFDSTDVDYLRVLWYEVYCAARGVELNTLSSERVIGQYYVEYNFKGKRCITPFAGLFGQRQFARSLENRPEATNIKLAQILHISPTELIDAIRAAAKRQ